MTNDHEKQNKKGDEDAEGAYQHPDTPLYREGYCSQFDSICGATIDGKIVTHKVGTTVLWYILRRSTSGTGGPDAGPVHGPKTQTSADTQPFAGGPGKGTRRGCHVCTTGK